MKDVRALAAKALARVIGKGESFSGELDTRVFAPNENIAPSQQNQNPTVADKDRAFYRELCYGTLRFYHRLDALLKPLLKKPLGKKDADIQALLLSGLYQIIYLRTPDHAAISASVDATKALKKPWARGLVNAVLRNFLRQRDGSTNKKDDLGTTAAANSHPVWLFDKLKSEWPADWQQIVDYNNAHPPMSLRVNLAKVQRDEYQQLLKSFDIQSEQDSHTPSGLLLHRAADPTKLPNFNEGWVSVQDQGAQLAAGLLELGPDMRVLDACAAPGGKAAHILEQEKNIRLTAIDSSSKRLLRVKENLSRTGEINQIILADSNDIQSWWDGELFDRILLDAPCSGSGVISHHPDIKLLRRLSDLDQFAEQQIRLLNSLWPTLADNGQLLYCTCSVMKEENQAVIDHFLAETPSAQALAIEAEWGQPLGNGRQLLPISGKNSGFFYARLSKTSAV